MAIPMNSGAKATEMGLSGPTAATAKAAQPTRPATSVARMAATVRGERMARTSHRTSSPSDSAAATPAPSESAENWSSESATGPVMRTLTPRPGTRPNARAAPCTSSIARWPGSTAL